MKTTTTKLLSLLLALCMVLSLAPVSALAENDAIEEAPAAEAVEESVSAPVLVSEPEPEPESAPAAPTAEEWPAELVEPSVPVEAAKAVPSQGNRGEISALTSDAGETGQAYYTLTASPAPIAGYGASSFVCTVQELQFGTVHVAGIGNMQAESFKLYFFAADPADPNNWDSLGFLSDEAGHTLRFSVGGDHGPQEQVGLFTPQTPVPVGFNMTVYVDPSDWDAAQPGTYTGYMYYIGEWICEDGYQVSGTARKIPLTVVVPDASAPHSVQIASMSNGSVTASPASALKEETVTLTVTPEEDYALDWLAVYKYAGGSTTTQTVPTEGGNGVYTFTMPATDVIVMAEFISVYPLTVGGVEVTAANASDILGDGKVSYDAAAATLTLADADIPAADPWTPSGVVVTREGVNLTICGTGTIRGGISANNSTITLNGDLEISTDGAKALEASVLVVSGGTVKIKAGSTAVSINDLTLENGEAIRRPQGGYFSAGMHTIMKDSYYQATEVVFSERDFHLITTETNIMHTGGQAAFTVDKQDAVEGETVTFTLVPAEGYMVDELVVQYKVPYEYHSGYEYYYITPDYDSAQGAWSFTMPGYDITLKAYIIDQTKTWEYLQTKIDENWMVTLHHDVTGDPEDVPLSIPSGRSVTIDLNGYTIDRGLTNGTAQTGGNAITNEGDLTIIDSSGDDSGKITGGYAEKGGAIYNTGTLTIQGGTICGNKASIEGGAIQNASGAVLTISGGKINNNANDTYGGGAVLNNGTMTLSGGIISENTAQMNGGGIWNGNGGVLNLTGGTISGNTARDNGSGIFTRQDGTLNMSGTPVVDNNTRTNLYLQSNTVINITGPVSGDALVGISGDNMPRAFTSGLLGKGTTDNFISDDPSYAVCMPNSEAELVKPVTATIDFDPGDENAEDEMKPRTVTVGSEYTLPECEFTVEGKVFAGWLVGSERMQPGDKITVTADTTVTAMWEKETYTVTIESDAGCVVTVYIEGPEGAGGVIASGDTVTAGTVLKVNAKAKAGYHLTTTPAESYTVNGDLTITAASALNTYTVTAAATEGGPAPTVSEENPVPYGTIVTVTAGAANEGYEFTGWYQTNGKRLSDTATYSFIVITNTTLEARYQIKTGKVTFMANDKVQKVLEDMSSVSEADFPDTPTAYYGFEFDGWDKTAEEINAELANGNVTVTAKFKAAPSTVTVTIYNGESDTPATQTYTENKWISVEALDVSGKSFAYWKMDDEILSYNQTATFRTSNDCTLTAVYAADAVEAVGTAIIETTTYNADSKKLVFVAYLTVPDGASITGAGLVAASGASTNYTPGDELTADNADYVKNSAKAMGTGGPVTYTWTKGNVLSGDTWYVRPYVIYTAQDGSEHTVYGSLTTYTAP